ncbi:LysR family transcriptional regulator [Amycolatopsis echigonensis]|uniref:LysR family transcriptional regulator n=2 Tax=Amycolatopsis TaxID=1813 RepID=A0A2N3WP31_9PSEU|nr:MULTISPECIES: LysR family transcriptional regulator [Amycolatopsis]PKV95639.1 LysR family transcriptional regulator [Amycolatopsis niigatensis]SFP39667.1 DNA-binding transcriptional regulator, LysR family [Amycolatopsis rubida]
MTIPQLRAFAAVVRYGSVKSAAAALGVSESTVSMHVAQLRKELGDPLFTRTGSGLAFTPGGLRLASRSVELLGLQNRTVEEIGQAAQGLRLLRVGATSLFAEHAAPGLIESFTQRATDLEVELSVHQASEFEELLRTRAIDVAIGPPAASPRPGLVQRAFLAYDVEVVTTPDHPLAGRPVSAAELARATWHLGPSAVGPAGAIPAMLQRLRVPESHQRIFQSEASALEEVHHAAAVAPAVVFSVSANLAAGRLVRVTGQGTKQRGVWVASAREEDREQTSAELLRFLQTPRATQAMIKGSGVPIRRFRPAVYVTLWS